MLRREGEIRIPSGCAIAGIINRQGERFDGSAIIASIANMHQRSNGLEGALLPMEFTRNIRIISLCIFTMMMKPPGS